MAAADEQAGLPVLYSFRRCPYAMRARLALSVSQVSVELREVILRKMPPTLLTCSPKGTVPVMLLPDGRVLEQSRDIMVWALSQSDPHEWLPAPDDVRLADINHLIDENDDDFKQQLDRYKYADRFPEHPAAVYRSRGEHFLQQLEQRLGRHAWLSGREPSVADIAIFPFVRQFAHVDRAWFEQAPYPCLQAWLEHFLQSPLFLGIMDKYPPWKDGDAVTRFPS